MSRLSSVSSQSNYPEMYARADPVALNRMHNEFFYKEDEDEEAPNNVITVTTTTTTTKEIRLPRSRAVSFSISDEGSSQDDDERQRFSNISSGDDRQRTHLHSRFPTSSSTSASLLSSSRSCSSSSLVRDPISGRLSFDDSRLCRDTGSMLTSLSRPSSNTSSSFKDSDSYDDDETSGWFSRRLSSPGPGYSSSSSIRSLASASDSGSDTDTASNDSSSFFGASASPTPDDYEATTHRFGESASDSDSLSPPVSSSFSSAIDSAKRGLRRVRSALSSSKYSTEQTPGSNSLQRSSSFSSPTGDSPTFVYSRDITSDDLFPDTPRQRVELA